MSQRSTSEYLLFILDVCIPKHNLHAIVLLIYIYIAFCQTDEYCPFLLWYASLTNNTNSYMIYNIEKIKNVTLI